ncbi:MAG: hypothetical protein NTV34_20015 [Proteobacteria bacterium]|nr:hypothetical protein [Pseudomonadota bacterium]
MIAVYDDWQKMAGRLTNLKDMKGIHQMSSFKFKQDAVTPLLQASLEGGSKVPLAVASYPGKGRAIWLFTDSMWRLGMDEDPERSRFDYHDFFDGALTWLMRNDRRSSLVASRFRVERSDDDRAVLWSVRLSGPAARFVGSRGSEWKVSICGNSMPLNSFSSEQHGPEEWTLSGSTVTPSHAGSMCGIKIEGQHQSFGSVEASSLAVFSETLKDSEMSPSPRKLRLLSELTGAKFISATENRSQIMADWLRTWTGAESQSLPNRFKTVRDFYWVFNRPWIWLVVLLLPLEVLIRRWHLMVGRESSLEIQDEGVG